jgi:hypothetical protein
MNTDTPWTRPEADQPQQSGATMAPTKAPGFVRAEGRTRKAGYWICGAGVAVIVSSFLPWVSIEGVETTHQSGGGVVMLLVIGGLLAYFGARVLQSRVTKAINVALWVIAALDVVLSIGLFAAADQLQQESGGIVSAAPTIGFYLAVGGFIASVVGTILVTTVRRKKAATTRPEHQGH